jgi:hypothetical protein
MPDNDAVTNYTVGMRQMLQTRLCLSWRLVLLALFQIRMNQQRNILAMKGVRLQMNRVCQILRVFRVSKMSKRINVRAPQSRNNRMLGIKVSPLLAPISSVRIPFQAPVWLYAWEPGSA